MSFEKFWKNAIAPKKDPIIVNIFKTGSIGDVLLRLTFYGLLQVGK